MRSRLFLTKITTHKFAAWLFVLAFVAGPLATAGTPPPSAKVPVEGVDYHLLAKPIATDSGNKIEVLEMFNFACIHCHDFAPKLAAWKQSQPPDVALRFEAAPYNPFFVQMARAYYAAKLLGKDEGTHEAIFRDVHDTHTIKPGDEETIVSAYASLGIDSGRFRAMYHSALVDEQLQKAKAILVDSDVGGVPALIVAGRYRIDAGPSVPFESMLATASYLIQLERSRRAAAH